VYIRETVCDDVHWIHMVQNRDRWWAVVNMAMKCGEYLDKLSDCHLLKDGIDYFLFYSFSKFFKKLPFLWKKKIRPCINICKSLTAPNDSCMTSSRLF
jgi:hypothetical protein